KQLNYKQEQLKNRLKKMNKAIIAFSGGVDSSFLLNFTHKILGENTIAVTINAPFISPREIIEAKEFTKMKKIKHKIINIEMKEIKTIATNPIDRCYHCKKLLFLKIKEYATKENINYVLDASNYNDLNDYRPGMKALKELEIESPMIDVKLTKEDIRLLSKEMNLKTWKKPSMACLASRFPYETSITPSKLEKVEKSEEYIQSLGVNQIRVRYYDQMARIEVLKNDFNIILESSNKIVEFMKKIGFKYITLDLDGYRTGSLNEDL
ncbi:MAG: ATP-dependent sacrificial sulfur transferase LarE, partial [Candidatus Lokiarchaeia archaeon]|nr:ATP-dependent sacrificial sulfur transferase LarE [Candidatus Lokiarchaeia archaeon]